MFDEIVERGQYTERDAASILQQLLGALDYLHGSNIIHRDLKVRAISLSCCGLLVLFVLAFKLLLNSCHLARKHPLCKVDYRSFGN